MCVYVYTPSVSFNPFARLIQRALRSLGGRYQTLYIRPAECGPVYRVTFVCVRFVASITRGAIVPSSTLDERDIYILIVARRRRRRRRCRSFPEARREKCARSRLVRTVDIVELWLRSAHGYEMKFPPGASTRRECER